MSTFSNETGYRRAPVSFVRRGSRLQGRRAQAWDEYADTFMVHVPRHLGDTSVDPQWRLDPSSLFPAEQELVVEVGTGLGENVVAAAQANPEQNFLGVEVYRPGLAQALQKAGPLGLENLRLVEANAPELFATALPESSVAQLWVFFPDPWHKSRHHKRRLISPAFLPLVNRILTPGGLWRVATDWVEYAAEISELISTDTELENLHPDTQGAVYNSEGARVPGVAERFAGRTITSFENKAHQAGREISDFTFARRADGHTS